MTPTDFITKYNVTLTYRPVKKTDPDWPGARFFRVTLKSNVGKFSLTYGIGSSLKESDITPKAVLECLSSDMTVGDTFDEFCGNSGYDADSRKAYRIWQACRRMRRRFEACMGAEMLEDLLNVEW